MRLIYQTTAERNLCERSAGAQHQGLRQLYPSSHYISVWPAAECGFEALREMRRAQARGVCEFDNRYPRFQILVDVRH